MAREKKKEKVLDLIDLFKYSKKAAKVKSQLDVLSRYILSRSVHEPKGWFYWKHFVEASISMDEAFLYMRSLFACFCFEDRAFSRALARAMMGSDAHDGPMSLALLEKMFHPKPIRKGSLAISQIMNAQALTDLSDAIESPSHLVELLTSQGEDGWILNAWFENKTVQSKKKLSFLEGKIFRVQTLLIIAYESSQSNLPAAEEVESSMLVGRLQHAWGNKYNHHKPVRDMGAFFKEHCQNCRIVLNVKDYSDEDEDEDFRGATSPLVQHTPMNTRQTSIMTPTVENPASEAGRRVHLLSSMKKRVSKSIQRMTKRHRGGHTPVQMETNRPIRGALFVDTNRSKTSTTEPVEPTFDWGSPVLARRSRVLFETVDEEVSNRRLKAQHFTYDESHQDRLFNRLLRKEERHGDSSTKEQDALKLLDTTLHLAAVGSSAVQATTKAMLIHSMANERVTNYLRNSGHSKKRNTLTHDRKISQVRARQRRAIKRGLQPSPFQMFVPRTIKRPLSNRNARAKCQRNYNEYLSKGRDIPATIRPCNLKATKIDWLVKWITDHFQFQPGRTQNVRFCKESQLLKNLPVYMRYGSFASLYESYSLAAPEPLRIGEKAFRDVLKATTVKGTYNQGLSYYYVDFQDMIKVVLTMLQRLQSLITKDMTISNDKKATVKLWIRKAKVNTEASKEYLIHHYYGEIQKVSNDGWLSATYALGHSKADASQLEFKQDAPLALALNNSILLVYVIELVMDAVAEEDLEGLLDEFLSMIDLAKLSSLEMLHYAKHLMRGWWQDTAINEMKKLIHEFPRTKGIVMDHKNKLLPKSKFEGMSAYFSKAGVSVLGAMVFWPGRAERKGIACDGVNAWFIDIIVNNTSSQEARDLMPGIETIRSELTEPYFVELAGKTDSFFFLSDNALVSASHLSFIRSLNNSSMASTNLDTINESDDDAGSSNLESVNNFGSASSIESVNENDNETIDENNIETGDESEGSDLVDIYLEELRNRYKNKICNWETCVEPYIAKWLTWEAQ